MRWPTIFDDSIRSSRAICKNLNDSRNLFSILDDEDDDKVVKSKLPNINLMLPDYA